MTDANNSQQNQRQTEDKLTKIKKVAETIYFVFRVPVVIVTLIVLIRGLLTG